MSENNHNDPNNEGQDWEKNAEEFANAQEGNDVDQPKIEKVESPVTSLGKAKSFQQDDRPLMADIGMKNIPLEHLPSRGMFYPPGTQIAIRAASVAEIRHWSTIDEEDLMGMDDMLNYVIERCCQLKIPGTASSWRDIKEIDRFYILFAIREYTFKDGENKIYVNVGEGDRVEVTKEMIKYFTMDERLMKYYDRDAHNLILKLKDGEAVDCYMPSIGVTQFIKNYVRGKQQQQAKFDQAFVKFAPFIFNDWRSLNQGSYERAVQDSSMWSLKKISVLSKVTDLLSDGIDPKVQYANASGAEVTAPLDFQGGIKSLFLISDIFDELV